MVSVELDSIIYALSSSYAVSPRFKKILIVNLKSIRDTARALEDKITIQVSGDETNVE